MGQLGVRSANGVLGTALNPNFVTPLAWIIRFTPQVFSAGDADFEIWHGAIRGPGGYFLVYLDNQLYGAAENGFINEYAPDIPMYVRKGQEVTLHWSIASTPAPQAWFYLRTPEVGRL